MATFSFLSSSLSLLLPCGFSAVSKEMHTEDAEDEEEQEDAEEEEREGNDNSDTDCSSSLWF